MTQPIYAFPPKPCPSLAIQGTEQIFPVHRIYCVGRNYADHAIEMGHDPAKEPPFFFQKNPDNIVTDGRFPYPPQSDDVHHEVELVVALNAGGDNLTLEAAENAIFGYAVGLDMTRRDLQASAKKAGRPWEIAKAFEHSAPCSPLVRRVDAPNLHAATIRLCKNGEWVQNGNLNQMIWKVPEIISTLSQFFTLEAGDLIMTGTPSGVGAVKRGDELVAEIIDLPQLRVQVI